VDEASSLVSGKTSWKPVHPGCRSASTLGSKSTIPVDEPSSYRAGLPAPTFSKFANAAPNDGPRRYVFDPGAIAESPKRARTFASSTITMYT
jgi:hypothetical protein